MTLKPIDRVNILSRALNGIAYDIKSKFIKRSHKGTIDGAYPFIPMDVSHFCDVVYKAFELLNKDRGITKPLYCGYQQGYTFIDAGCGPGLTLTLARAIGFGKVMGVDIDPNMVEMAKILNPEAKIFCQDIRKCRMYGKANVVYYFVPMYNNSMQEQFEQYLARCLKPGAFVIACGSDAGFYRNDWFDRAAPEIYRKRRFPKGKKNGNHN